MKGFRRATVLLLVLAFSGEVLMTGGQGPFRATEQQLEQLSAKLETHSSIFQASANEAIAQSVLNDAEVGGYLKRFVHEFGVLTDRLRSRIKGRNPISADVQEVLNRAEYIDSFMVNYELAQKAKDDWDLLRADLDLLADYYSLKTHWKTPLEHGIPQTVRVEALENRLIGTYKLDPARSNDVRKVVERSLSEMPTNARVRLQITLVRQLRSPKLIAIDRDRGQIAFRSSLQPDRIYEVEGRAQTAMSERVASLLFGGQFRINTGQDSDGLYSATFGSTSLGAKLQVTRTALLKQFKRPIVVSSYYTKISDAAEFDLSEEEDPNPFRGTSNSNRRKN